MWIGWWGSCDLRGGRKEVRNHRGEGRSGFNSVLKTCIREESRKHLENQCSGMFFYDITVFTKNQWKMYLMLFQLHLCYNNKSRWVLIPVQRSRFSPSFDIGFLAIGWSSKPIRTSFPLPSVPLPIPAPTQCVCVLHAIPVTSLSSGSAAGSFCSVFNQNECGCVCECLLPWCTSKTSAYNASIQVVRAAHSSFSQKM